MAIGAIGSALIGNAAGSLLGGLFGDDGQEEAALMNAAMMNEILNGYREESVQNQLFYREARRLYGERTDEVLADLGRAEAEMRGSSREAQRGVAARGAQTQGAVTQNLTSRGLTGSTIAANAQRGVASDVSRGIAGIQQQEGSLLAGLNQQRAGVRSGLLRDEAELGLREQQSRYQIQRDRLGYMGGIEFQAQPDGLASFFGTAGSLAGFAAGGGFGGGGGFGSVPGSFGTFSGFAPPGIGGMGGTFA